MSAMTARVSQAEAITAAPDSVWDGAEPGRLSGPGLIVGRAAFLVTLTALVALNLIALPGTYTAFFAPGVADDLRRMGVAPAVYGAIMLAQYGVIALAYLTPALLIFWRRS